MAIHTDEQVELLTQDVLRRANALSAPVDLSKIAGVLGVAVHMQPFEDQVSGALVIKDGQRYVLVNQSHHPNRQRFTIAHEFGHLVLHDTSKDRLFIDTEMRVYQRVGEPTSAAYQNPGSETTPQEEREANMFAAALLMPLPLIQLAAFKYKLSDEYEISTLARDFGVSEIAMSIRLQRLHLVQTF